jgi:sulfur-carrier protein
VKVEVRAFATLSAFLPRETREAAVLEVPDGSTVGDLVRFLGVPDEMTVIALLNGCEAEPDQILKSDDVVTLFPPLVGGGLGPLQTSPCARGVTRTHAKA